MGGAAFPDLEIVRIPSALYPSVLEYFQALLSPRLFSLCRSPKCAPEKVTHGDLDFLVTLPEGCSADDAALSSLQESINTLLGAAASSRCGPTTSYAVPCPILNESLIQLDLHLCNSAHSLQWLFFLKSYGDFSNILGTISRQVGLVANHGGLCLRLSHLKLHGGPLPLLKLTEEPSEMLRFYGLDERAYSNGWNTMEQMFEFIRSCRFYSGPLAVAERELKAKDRYRAKNREAYQRWLAEEEVRLQMGVKRRPPLSRDTVREEATEVFSKVEELKRLEEEFYIADKVMKDWEAVREWLPVETDRQRTLKMKSLRKRWEKRNPADGDDIVEFAKRKWEEMVEEMAKQSKALEGKKLKEGA